MEAEAEEQFSKGNFLNLSSHYPVSALYVPFINLLD